MIYMYTDTYSKVKWTDDQSYTNMDVPVLRRTKVGVAEPVHGKPIFRQNSDLALWVTLMDSRCFRQESSNIILTLYTLYVGWLI